MATKDFSLNEDLTAIDDRLSKKYKSCAYPRLRSLGFCVPCLLLQFNLPLTTAHYLKALFGMPLLQSIE